MMMSPPFTIICVNCPTPVRHRWHLEVQRRMLGYQSLQRVAASHAKGGSFRLQSEDVAFAFKTVSNPHEKKTSTGTLGINSNEFTTRFFAMNNHTTLSALTALLWIFKATLRMLSAVVAVWLCSSGNVVAQVPQLISYQGRVAVAGANYSGSGLFKFALVNGPSGTTTYWSNDGTSVAGGQPTNAVTLTVANGLYSLLLGDTTLTNMTAVPNSVFSNSDVRLRIWFNDGTNGWQQFTPDQRIAAVGYAIMASGVTDGAITSSMIAPAAVGSTQLAAQGVATANLADGSVTAAKLNSAVSTLISAAKISSIQNYGTSPTTGTPVSENNLKICYGQALMAGTSTQTISGLPFASAASYTVIATRNNASGYTTQAVVVAKTDGTQFVIKDFTVDSPINWTAIGN